MHCQSVLENTNVTHEGQTLVIATTTATPGAAAAADTLLFQSNGNTLSVWMSIVGTFEDHLHHWISSGAPLLTPEGWQIGDCSTMDDE